MARSADGFIGLAPDAPAYPPEWREACGRAWAIERVRSGQPSDPLLFALVRHHPRLHDGRSVDEAERERIRQMLDQPDAPAPTVAMAEVGEAPRADSSAARRARIARAVPSEPVRGWVPPHKRAPAVGANVAAGGDGTGGGSAYLPRRDPQPHGASLLRTLASQPAIAGASTSTPPVEAPASFPAVEIPPQSAPQVVARPPTSDCAPETARSADAPAVIPPAAGAPVAVAGAAPARQSAPAASTGGMGGSALRQRPAAAPASTPPCSPAAAVTATSPSALDLDFRDADGFRWAIGPGGWVRLAGGLAVDGDSGVPAGCWPPAASFATTVPALRSPITMRRIRDVVQAHYELRAGELESPARAERIVRPRQTAMWLCRTLTKASLPQIGRCFGGRDHTTVMHAVMTVDARRGVDPAFAADVDDLMAKIRGGRLLVCPS